MHREIIKSYLHGLQLGAEDQVILCDVCPNRPFYFTTMFDAAAVVLVFLLTFFGVCPWHLMRLIFTGMLSSPELPWNDFCWRQRRL